MIPERIIFVSRGITVRRMYYAQSRWIEVPTRCGRLFVIHPVYEIYRGADKSLARCILFDGDNISFDASLVIYI